ncbi:uncharacterized protein TRAVEDRAFT_30886, partial [Trametes versicolor FP-101664 SS1]|uniref:uncharacterized protein n=1 Tax=Trametes versicolor (strain FP-101664) TaxID=717944 RepID=UPI000462256B
MPPALPPDVGWPVYAGTVPQEIAGAGRETWAQGQARMTQGRSVLGGPSSVHPLGY